jgi:membrane-bound lytic murein transglycosylase A
MVRTTTTQTGQEPVCSFRERSRQGRKGRSLCRRLTGEPDEHASAGVLFLALVITVAAADSGHARRYPSPASPHAAVVFQSPAPAAPAADDASPGPFKIPNAALEPVGWGHLDGWAGDDHASAFAAFYGSCRPIVRAYAFRAESFRRSRYVRGESLGFPLDARPVRVALEDVCARAVKAGRLPPEAARQFFETNFVPVRIRRLGDPAGFLTGYYEPIVDGSRFPTREFTVPLYRRPRDLVAPGVPDGGPFPNTGRALRRTATGELVPYYDRGQIEDGALDGQHLEICWLRNAADALAVQIEGSARIRLEDGAMLRINYDAHNGYPFVPAGRVLVEHHLMARNEMSSQRTVEWMRENPEGAKEVRRQNRQIVFFRIVGLDDDGEAIGAQGVPLSPGRSLAVDKALHVYGTPFFIEADLPESRSIPSAFRRVMIAQDTGSAIVGPARADLYLGAGDEAGQVANRIRQNGRFTILLPRELDPAAAGARMPLPPVKPLPVVNPVPPAKPSPQVKPLPSQVATRAPQSAVRLAAPEERRRWRQYYYYYTQ